MALHCCEYWCLRQLDRARIIDHLQSSTFGAGSRRCPPCSTEFAKSLYLFPVACSKNYTHMSSTVITSNFLGPLLIFNIEDTGLISSHLIQASIGIADATADITVLQECIKQANSMIEQADIVFQTTHHRQIKWQWRQLYTDATILSVLGEIIRSLQHESSSTTKSSKESFWVGLVSKLDLALVVAGAPGDSRRDLIHDLIRSLQDAYLPLVEAEPDIILASTSNLRLDGNGPLTSPLLTAASHIPTLSRPASIGEFLSRYIDKPFIIRGFALDWPALDLWHSTNYLLKSGGRGRIVPVEVGSDYTSEDWSQRMIPWETFLGSLGDSDTETAETDSTTANYLAQHSLLDQFPSLRNDIHLPDYVYSSPPPPPSFPGYLPPANEDQLIINAWIGPKGTISPAHHVSVFSSFISNSSRCRHLLRILILISMVSSFSSSAFCMITSPSPKYSEEKPSGSLLLTPSYKNVYMITSWATQPLSMSSALERMTCSTRIYVAPLCQLSSNLEICYICHQNGGTR